MLESVQIVFFSVSTIGVIIATLNHFWFVKDRNAQTLISITNLFESSHKKFVSALNDDVNSGTATVQFLNILTVYCHMHNHKQLRPKTKLVHERYVARILAAISKGDLLQKDTRNVDVYGPTGDTEIMVFIGRNHSLFPNFDATLAYFSPNSK